MNKIEVKNSMERVKELEIDEREKEISVKICEKFNIKLNHIVGHSENFFR